MQKLKDSNKTLHFSKSSANQVRFGHQQKEPELRALNSTIMRSKHYRSPQQESGKLETDT
jgi:hypothetical protein